MEQAIIKKDETALQSIGAWLQIEPKHFIELMKKQFIKDATDAEIWFMCSIVNKYKLDPFKNEIGFMRNKYGKVIPLVEVDAWQRMANEKPDYEGVEYEFIMSKEKNVSGTYLDAITTKLFRKGRIRPTIVTEWMEECYMPDSKPWQKLPRRMLKHKSYIQAVREAYNFSEIKDPDEFEKIIDCQTVEPEDEIIIPIGKSETKAIEPAKEITPDIPKVETEEEEKKPEKPLSESEVLNLILDQGKPSQLQEEIERLEKIKTLREKIQRGIPQIPEKDYIKILEKFSVKHLDEVDNPNTLSFIHSEMRECYKKLKKAS
jgi:hypothetical protein